jgi:hypothetical protein
MIGAILTDDLKILHVGTSANYPAIPVQRPQVSERYKLDRKAFLQERLWQYDAFIHSKIQSDDPAPTRHMPLMHRITAQMLTGHKWVVFRGKPNLQLSHPLHYEPRCGG